MNWQSVEENYSSVNVKVNFWRTNSVFQTYGSGTIYCKINGTTYSESVSPSQKITSSGITLFNKDVSVYHNNDGSKYLDTSAWISHNTPLPSSEQWYGEWLSGIPRAATFSSADNFNDEQNPKIYFNNPGGFKLQLKMEAGDNDHLIVRNNLYPSSPYTFLLTEEERNKLRNLCTNSNTLPVRFTIATYMPGSSSPSNHSYGDRTMNIVNANPGFNASQLTYQDTNTAVTEVTKNNQLIIRNKSNLQVNFTSATAQKSSSINKYQIIFNGTTSDKSSSGAYSLGTVNSSKNLTVQVKAIDSRGNSTTVSKSITILDWTAPIINVSSSRINNYENETNLIANVQISSVNNLNSLQSLQYRTKKTSDISWSSWINFQNNTQIQLNFNNLFAWDLEVKAADKFGQIIQKLSISKGTPIVFFDTKKLSVGINCFPKKSNSLEVNSKTIFDMIYPVGSIYFSINSANPGSFFGGTWVTWGQGRVPVCVDINDGDFNYSEKIGGHKKIQSHTHGVQIDYAWNVNHMHGSRMNILTEGVWDGRGGSYDSYGAIRYAGEGNSENLHPYITCYIWKRTG